MTTENRAGRWQTIADTRAWVRAFFDGTVRGEWARLKRLTKEAQPAITVYAFGKLRPWLAVRIRNPCIPQSDNVSSGC